MSYFKYKLSFDYRDVCYYLLDNGITNKPSIWDKKHALLFYKYGDRGIQWWTYSKNYNIDINNVKDDVILMTLPFFDGELQKILVLCILNYDPNYATLYTIEDMFSFGYDIDLIQFCKHNFEML